MYSYVNLRDEAAVIKQPASTIKEPGDADVKSSQCYLL